MNKKFPKRFPNRSSLQRENRGLLKKPVKKFESKHVCSKQEEQGFQTPIFNPCRYSNLEQGAFQTTICNSVPNKNNVSQ